MASVEQVATWVSIGTESLIFVLGLAGFIFAVSRFSSVNLSARLAAAGFALTAARPVLTAAIPTLLYVSSGTIGTSGFYGWLGLVFSLLGLLADALLLAALVLAWRMWERANHAADG